MSIVSRDEYLRDKYKRDMSQSNNLQKAKVGFEKYQQFVKKFAYSDFYLLLVSVVIFIGWATKSSIFGIGALTIISCLVLLAADDVLPLCINIFGAVLLVYSFDVSDYIFMLPLLLPLLICLVFFIVRNAKHKFTLGKMFYPQIAVTCALFLGGIGVISVKGYFHAFLDILMLGVGVLLVYMFFNHYLKRDPQRDIALYFAKVMMYLGLVVCIQLIVTIIRRNVPPSLWNEEIWNVGWGNRNSIANYLLLTAPMCFYLSSRYRQGWIYLTLGIFQYLCLILSFSRGGILFGAVSGVCCVIFSIIKAPNRKKYFLYYGIILAVVLAFYLIFIRKINDMLDALIARGFGTSGRSNLYKEAWELFKAHPFLGVGKGYVGIYASTPSNSNAMGIYWFHCNILQVLANMGIVGAAAYLFFYGMRFYLLFKSIKKSFNLFVLAVWLGFEGYCLINTGTFVFYPCMCHVILTSLLLERNNEISFEGYVSPYNCSTEWGANIARIMS